MSTTNALIAMHAGPRPQVILLGMRLTVILMFINSQQLQTKKCTANLRWKHALLKQLVLTANSKASFFYHASILTFFLTYAPCANAAQGYVADFILKNGRVYADPYEGSTWAQAVSIRNGSILTVGSNLAAEKDKGLNTKIIDLKGRVVLPGFNDSHLHLVTGGLNLLRVDLTRVKTAGEVLERIRTYASAHPEAKWIFGQGLDPAILAGSITKTEIDSVISDRPVLIWHIDNRALILNSKGLEIARITPKTPDPARGGIKTGEIFKTQEGLPTGVLSGEAALEVSRRVDTPSLEEIKRAILLAQQEALAVGITSIQGGPIRGELEVQALSELHEQKQLHLRYALWGDLERPHEFLALKEKYKSLPEEWVRFETVKGFIDGVLSSHTAALLEQYSDLPQSRGEPFYTQTQLNELVMKANKLGFSVALHATGDRAAAMAINSYVQAAHLLFNARQRNRVEHLEVVPPFIFDKFGRNNFIASVQPSHLIYDRDAQNFNQARLGPSRVKTAFAFKSFTVARAPLAFGSDWPVMPLNPMIGIYGAVYRQNQDGKPFFGWMPQQKISIEQAIHAYTFGGAFATREDHVKGTIRDGKFADLIVLEKDPFKISGKAHLQNKVVLTIAGGKIVYDASVPAIKSAN